MSGFKLRKVLSGGQTGVDQAALRVAKALGFEIGGWCPPGRQSEAGPIPGEFPLRETPEERSADAADVPRSLRTEWNVRDADATLILRAIQEDRSPDKIDPGTRWTALAAVLHGKPTLTCRLDDPREVLRARRWLEALGIETLTIAGASEARVAGIGRAAEEFLALVLRR
jgi:Circularly permutated YpsA SLOG family